MATRQCKPPVMTWPEKIRFTRAGGCGEVLFGPAHSYVTSDFESAAVVQQITEGETWSRTKANGGICCSVKRPDRVDFDTWTYLMCTLDPALLAAANETYQPLYNYQGQLAGHSECYDLNARNGLFQEMWVNMCSPAAACDADENVTQSAGIWLWVWAGKLKNFRRGDLTFSSTPEEIQLIGTTESGHQWGRGPVPMMFDAQGQPALLPEPLRDCARIADMRTTMEPPEDTCGWEPLSNPNGPKFTIECVAGSDGLTLLLRLVGDQTGTRLVDWGDGSPATVITGGEATHAFDAQWVTDNGGSTWVGVWDPDRPQMYSASKVRLPCTPVTVTVTPLSGPAPLTVQATVDGCTGKATANWGDN
jgi:hypothetical protein